MLGGQRCTRKGCMTVQEKCSRDRAKNSKRYILNLTGKRNNIRKHIRKLHHSGIIAIRPGCTKSG